MSSHSVLGRGVHECANCGDVCEEERPVPMKGVDCYRVFYVCSDSCAREFQKIYTGVKGGQVHDDRPHEIYD